jgi:hypothetical protein
MSRITKVEAFVFVTEFGSLICEKKLNRIYGRSSIKFAHFVPIHLQTWPTQAIPVPDWSI